MRAAAVQMVSGLAVADNLAQARELISRAADAGARLVVLPENFALMPRREDERLVVAEDDGDGPIQRFLAEQAARHRITLVGGTIALHASRSRKVRAACLVFGPAGERLARYDKIHLFDVDLENGERYHESESIEAGTEAVAADTEFGRIGLAVCYDLRFPELFRALLDTGAGIIAVPAAFTAHTGRAHWHVLVRARAIENQLYIVAAAQGGGHENGRATYGHSLVVDPWGEVVAERDGDGAGVVVADIDPDRTEAVRRSLPSVRHRRL